MDTIIKLALDAADLRVKQLQADNAKLRQLLREVLGKSTRCPICRGYMCLPDCRLAAALKE